MGLICRASKPVCACVCRFRPEEMVKREEDAEVSGKRGFMKSRLIILSQVSWTYIHTRNISHLIYIYRRFATRVAEPHDNFLYRRRRRWSLKGWVCHVVDPGLDLICRELCQRRKHQWDRTNSHDLEISSYSVYLRKGRGREKPHRTSGHLGLPMTMLRSTTR